MLVKQNMADAVVFAVVCWAVAWRRRSISRRTFAAFLALSGVGAAIGCAVVMLWAMAHGTSPLAVYEATYPFRLEAGQVISAAPGDAAEIRLERLDRLALAAVLTGGPLVLATFGAFMLRRTHRSPVVWGVVAALAFAAVSILAGGSYWLHYLIEAVPAVALAAGAVATSCWENAIRLSWLVASAIVISAIVTLVSVLGTPTPRPGAAVGQAIASSAYEGDTVVSAFGDPDILWDTGMSSPYPYLWSLPSRTLDPDLTSLRAILAAAEAPTWIVVRDRHALERFRTAEVWQTIEQRYRRLGEACSRQIYLLRGVDRPPLRVERDCSGLILP